MKKSLILPLLMLIKFSIVLTSDSLNAQWQWIQTSYPSFKEAYSIEFVNDNTGFLLGSMVIMPYTYGFIQKSTDAGITWEGKILRDEIDSNKRFSRCIKSYFLNETTGYVTGNRNYIFKTTDSGITWRAADVPSGQNPMIYNDIVFVNENTGYACGRTGYIIKTTNAGESWNLIYTSPFSDVVSIWFFDQNTGIAGDQYGGIYKTTDAGSNWSYYLLTDSNDFRYAHNRIQFLDDNTGFIFARNTPINRSIVYKTTNQGANWSQFYNEHDIWVENGYLLSPDKGFLIARGNICKYTSDGGKTWQNVFVGSNTDTYLGIDFINDNTGFISSHFGYVYKTTNGGTVSIGNEISLIPEKFKLHQNFPNPFNPTTNIKFSLPSTQYTVLKVFDALGREVASLVNENLQAGVYQYQFTTDKYQLPSGVYFYRLNAGEFSETKRLVLLK